MRNDGRVFATFFLVDDFGLHSQSPESFITFNHYLRDGCYINDINHPIKIVGYKIWAVEAMARDAGLALAVPQPVPDWSVLGLQSNVVLRRRNSPPGQAGGSWGLGKPLESAFREVE